MREIRIEKVTLNIGCGSDQDKLKRAQKLLQSLTDRKPLITRTKRRSTFGMPKKKVPLQKKPGMKNSKLIKQNILNWLQNLNVV